MTQIGYIENGQLRTRVIEEYVNLVKDENGVPVQQVVTEEEQIQACCQNGFKPVDEIDESRRVCETGQYVKVTPVDLGDHIGFEYETIVDRTYYKNRVRALKQELDDSDYKITKCYEASIVGETLPYNVSELHSERQAVRDEINRIEGLLSEQ